MKNKIKKYDVVIIGAGPAGCQCARMLADKKLKILIVDQFKDFNDNDFSSAGSPLEILNEFNLPESVIGSVWNELKIYTSKTANSWLSDKPLGVVFDFTKLKQFLLSEAKKRGCEIRLGYRFLEYELNDNDLLITIENLHNSEKSKILSTILVDATGPSRAIINPKKENSRLINAVGLEYLIKAPKDIQNYFPNALQFF
jgi:digeranylgeranylglycerophospholipid reductase